MKDGASNTQNVVLCRPVQCTIHTNAQQSKHRTHRLEQNSDEQEDKIKKQYANELKSDFYREPALERVDLNEKKIIFKIQSDSRIIQNEHGF